MLAAPPIDDLITAISNALEAGQVDIWRPDSDAWRDAIRQQVLQIGAAEVKKDVKTGAADAVVLACANAYSYVSEHPVVLVSSDKRLRVQASEEVEDLFVASGIREVLEHLASFEPATEDLEVRAAEVLPDILNERIGEGDPALAFDEFGVELWLGNDPSGNRPTIQPRDIYFSQVDLVEFHDFEVTKVGDERFGLGDMRIFGEFGITFVEQREDSLGNVELVADSAGPFTGAYVDVTVAINWDLTWQFKEITATGAAVAVLSDDDWDEEGEDVPVFRAAVAAR